MAENRKLVYNVEINAGKANEVIDLLSMELKDLRKSMSLLQNEKMNVDTSKMEASISAVKNEIDELRKSVGDVKNQKISIDGSGIKTTVEEIRKELDGIKKSFNEISNGNLKISDSNIRKVADDGAKGIEGLQVAAKGATAELQTYTAKLNLTRTAIDNLTQLMKNGITTKIEVNGVEYTMAQLRALEQAYVQVKKDLKAGSLEAQEKAQVKLTESVTQYERAVNRVNAQIEKGNIWLEGDYKNHQNILETKQKEIEALKEQYNLEAKISANPLKDDARYNTYSAYSSSMADQNAMRTAEKLNTFRSYSSEISKLNAACEELYRTYRRDPSRENLDNFAKMRRALSDTEQEYAKFQRRVEGAGFSLADFGRKFRSHAAWISTGMFIGGGLAAPSVIESTIERIESNMASIRQVIPALEANPMDAGTAGFTEQQQKMNKAMTDYIDIASRYGASTDEVMDAARRLGRMYGQGDEGPERVRMLTDQAAKMSVADAFPMEDAVKGLESAMAQWNLQSDDSNTLMRNSQYIIDIWTKTAHNGAASAQDIGQAIENAGTAAAQAGVSFDFFNSLVETGVRTTARSGNEIGQSIKSMMVSMQSDKALKALEDWGIKTKEIDKDGKEHVRSMQDIIMDTSLMVSTTTKDTQQLMTILAGGRYQYSKVSAILKNYKEILRMQGIINGDGPNHDQPTLGFTDRQVGVQLDTIQRKFATIKADAENLFVDIGKNGGLETLKWIANKLDDLIVGFRKISENGPNSMQSTALEAAKLLLELKALQVVATKLASITITNTSAATAAWRTSGKSTGLSQRIASWIDDKYAQGASRGTASAANTAVTNGSTAAITANSGALTGNASANARDTASIGANSGARKANEITIAGQTMRTRELNGVALTESAALARSAARMNIFSRAILSSSAGLGAFRAKLQATAVGAKIYTVAADAATLATRVFSTALAAFGGIPGLIATAVITLGTSFLFDAESAGEAENATKRLQEAHEEFSSTIDEQIQLVDQQGRAAEQLANQYNNLVDKINSGTLSDEEAKKAKEELADMSKTLTQIVGEEGVQTDESGKISVDAINKVIDAKRQETIQNLKDDSERKQQRIDQIEGDIAATKAMKQGVAERIRSLKDEIQQCKNTAHAYSLLHSVIAKAKADAGQQLKDEATKELGYLNHYHEDGGIGQKIADWMIDARGGPDAVRQQLSDMWNQGQQEIEDSITYATSNGQTDAAMSIFDKYIGDSDTLEADAETYEGTQDQLDEMATLRNQIAENSVKLTNYQNGTDQIQPEPRGEVQGNGDDGKGGKGSGDSSTPRAPKKVYEYDSDVAKAAANAGIYLKEYGFDPQTMLALTMVANGLNGISKEDFAGLTNPAQVDNNDTGDAWGSYYGLTQKIMGLVNGNQSLSAMEIIGKLYPNIDTNAFEDLVTKIKKGESGTAFSGYDFETRLPKNGSFLDPNNNNTASDGYAHDYENGGYSNAHIREVADKAAAVITEKTGQQINSNFLYGQLMAEDPNNQYHNYAGIGPGKQYASDEEFINAYAYEYYADENRMNALHQPTAWDFVRTLDNVDANDHPGRDAWNASDNQRQYAANIDQYANEGNEQTTQLATQTSAIQTIGDLVASIAQDNNRYAETDQWMGNVTSDKTIQCDSFTANVYGNAGIGDIGGYSTSGTINDDAFKAAGAYHEADSGYTPQAGDLISASKYNHYGIYLGNDMVRSRDSGGGIRTRSLEDWGNIFGIAGYGSLAEATKGQTFNLPQGGVTAQGTGNNVKHWWKGVNDFAVSGYEMKQAMDKLVNALHEAAKVTLEYQAKVRGTLNIDQYRDARNDASAQVGKADRNYDYWVKQRKQANDNVYSILHDGKHNSVLSTIGNTDFGKLPAEAQTRLAKDSKDPNFQNAVKAYQATTDERDKAYTEKVKARETLLDTQGFMNPDELFNARIKDIDAKYETEKNTGAMTEDAANTAAAKEKLALAKEYRVELMKTMEEAQKESAAELAGLKAQVPEQEAAVKAAQEKYDAEKKNYDELVKKAKSDKRYERELPTAELNLGHAEDALKQEKATLDGLNQDIKVHETLGNKLVQDTANAARNVVNIQVEAEKTINKNMMAFNTTIKNEFHTFFSDILLQGKSFADSFKNLWKNLGQFALNILMSRWLDPLIDRWIPFRSTGGSVPKRATGGIIGYAGGGQPGGAIHGAGTGTSDSILAYLANKDQFVYLSNGEYVMTEEATKRIGKDKLDKMNYGKYAAGGAINPTPYVPNLSPVATKKAQSLTRENSNKRLEELMVDQTNTIKKMGGDGGNGGGVVILNTHASSDDVMKALAENPRAVQAILGRQRHYGFR